MGLDVMFFAGNPSTRQARVFGQFRNTWWVVDQFKVADEQNCCDVEISVEQLNDFLAHMQEHYSKKNGPDVIASLAEAVQGVDWKNEKFYVNCWW